MGWDADVIMSPAMSLPSQRSCHWPRHCHVIGHVNIHVIIAIHVIAKSTATSSAMSSMCDMAIEFVTKIILFMIFIRHRKWVWVGLWGPGTVCDVFETSWIKQFMTKI